MNKELLLSKEIELETAKKFYNLNGLEDFQAIKDYIKDRIASYQNKIESMTKHNPSLDGAIELQATYRAIVELKGFLAHIDHQVERYKQLKIGV